METPVCPELEGQTDIDALLIEIGELPTPAPILPAETLEELDGFYFPMLPGF